MRTILVTGGAGFIGANFVCQELLSNPHLQIYNIDALTYAGSLDKLQELVHNPRHRFIKGNICDQNLLTRLFSELSFDAVVHFAAESHVDNSISGPAPFIETNIRGTFCLLEAMRTHKKNIRFVHVSTDEVYGSLGPVGHFTENSPYAPNSPYSASKAASDLLVRSYHKTYGLDTVTTHCSNNFGPKQHREKLIPVIIANAIAHRPIPIYGSGKNVRDWLFVLDHCSAIAAVLEKGRSGEHYNIGADNEWTNIDLATCICEALDSFLPWERPYASLLSFVQDRLGHDLRYAISAEKIRTELGWKPLNSFNEGLQKTLEYYVPLVSPRDTVAP